MDYKDVSPRYMMELVPKVESALWALFENAKYENVRRYIQRWHTVEYVSQWDEEENFKFHYKDEERKTIDLAETLHNMPNDLLIKIAIDLGIDTPAFLPAVPEFKNVLKDENQSAYQNFVRATKNVHENPDESVSLASSTLEGIIKTILADENFVVLLTELKGKSLTRLTISIVKEFGFNDSTKCPPELITIAGQLRGLGKTIDDLRSDKTTAHGKAHDEYVVDDPLWASFIVNTSASLGMFLWEYYVTKYRPATKARASNDVVIEDIGDEPINLDDIPF